MAQLFSEQSILRYWIDVFFILIVSTLFGVFAEENSKENRNVQNKEDINPISEY